MSFVFVVSAQQIVLKVAKALGIFESIMMRS